MINELLSSIIVSGLGAIVAFAAARAWTLFRAVRLQQLCSLAGTFVTQFEQSHDGLQVMRRAVTQISQYGLDIRGVTTEVETNRSWELEGRIERSGFLRATYRSADADAINTKTLLLAIDRGGNALNGLWASYDSLAREVASGQYLMTRCADGDEPAAR